MADLPVSGRPLVVWVTVRRFFCDHADCSAGTFVEQVPGLTERHARRSAGLQGAFGWRTVRVDGNDINALVDAFESVPAGDSPAVVICDTRIGRGVPFLETREKAHFIRIDEHEWDLARQALRAANPAGSN